MSLHAQADMDINVLDTIAAHDDATGADDGDFDLQMRIPSDHQSAGAECPLFAMISGAMYSGVPQTVYVRSPGFSLSGHEQKAKSRIHGAGVSLRDSFYKATVVTVCSKSMQMLPLRKAKVCDLDVAHIVKQKVLWLEITENYAASMLRSQQPAGSKFQFWIRIASGTGRTVCWQLCYSDQAWLTM